MAALCRPWEPTETERNHDMKTKTELVGYAGVDAGLIWIGDPCYVLPDDAKHGYGNWSDFCDILHTEENMEKPAVSFSYEMGHEGLGICIKNFGGDGLFPVYVEVDTDGRVRSARIVFYE